MNRQEGSKTRYYVQWDTHARHMCTVLCNLMEHQSLVDLAICCGTNTIHAHKCVLAANSPYFREQLEKNAGTEQVIITGLDFSIVKSIIEFMYCGETNILDENLKYMTAAAKFFRIRGLQSLVSDRQDMRYDADAIHITPPIFLPKKPKYPNAYHPLNNAIIPNNFEPFKSPLQNDPYFHRKIKRKFVRSEAEKACAKEAAASRLALEALQKELATTSQMNSFVIEESCTETTVENFIPHSDETYIENINQVDNDSLQVVNYDLNNSLLNGKADCANSLLQYGIPSNTTKDKLRSILGADIPGNVEIMFRTNDGSFVSVNENVLQNLTQGTLQYQIVDENGQVGEIRELQVQDQSNTISYDESQSSIIDTSNELSVLENMQSTSEATEELVTEIMAPFTEESNIENSYNINVVNVAVETPVEELVNIENASVSSSTNKECNSTPEDNKMDDTNAFIEILKEPEPPLIQTNHTFLEDCDINQFFHLTNIVEENKENMQPLNKKSTPEQSNCDLWKGNEIIDLGSTVDTILSVSSIDALDGNVENGGGDVPLKKIKLDSDVTSASSKFSLPSFVKDELPWKVLENQIKTEYSPRKTRSTSTVNKANSLHLDECKEIINDVKLDKPRRIMPNRKKKLI